jgi:hypothetical protein
MDWGFVIQVILAILGASLIAGGIVAYRRSGRTGVRGFAAAAIGAGGVMWIVVAVTLPVSDTANGPEGLTAEKVNASPTSGTPESTEVSLVQSMKGYELYSWQRDGDWHFALLVGTNRIKTHDEVTSPEAGVQGTEALKRELSRLPKGEPVVWSPLRVAGLTMPPNDTISEINEYSAQLGIQLEIDR